MPQNGDRFHLPDGRTLFIIASYTHGVYDAVVVGDETQLHRVRVVAATAMGVMVSASRGHDVYFVSRAQDFVYMPVRWMAEDTIERCDPGALGQVEAYVNAQWFGVHGVLLVRGKSFEVVEGSPAGTAKLRALDAFKHERMFPGKPYVETIEKQFYSEMVPNRFERDVV